MAIAHINAYRNTEIDTPASAPNLTATPTLAAVPAETEARGFALYVGIDEATAKAAGTNLAELVAALRKTVAEFTGDEIANEQTYAAVALAPKGVGGRNVDVVRTALRDPRAIDKLTGPVEADAPADGIVVDLNRKKVFINGANAGLTYKEFELLSYIIDNQGETISRSELVDVIWADDAESTPNDRTIDVHIRRLRSKIVGYEDIIRTVRGGGYRFDKHPDVLIEN